MCNDIHEEINRFNFKVVVEIFEPTFRPTPGKINQKSYLINLTMYHWECDANRDINSTRRVDHLSTLHVIFTRLSLFLPV